MLCCVRIILMRACAYAFYTCSLYNFFYFRHTWILFVDIIFSWWIDGFFSFLPFNHHVQNAKKITMYILKIMYLFIYHPHRVIVSYFLCIIVDIMKCIDSRNAYVWVYKPQGVANFKILTLFPRFLIMNRVLWT